MQQKVITVPVFPLNMVIMPGETKLLHVFESRYKELLKDCLENGAHFGIVLLKNGKIADYGTTVKITRVLKTNPDGGTDIMVQGVEPFKIVKYFPVLSPKLYGAANVEQIMAPNITENTQLFDSVTKYFKYLKNREVHNNLDFGVSIYQVASLLELTNEEKLEILTLDSLARKEDFLINKIRLFIHLLTTEKKLNGEFWLN